jgi:hypothetical protein
MEPIDPNIMEFTRSNYEVLMFCHGAVYIYLTERFFTNNNKFDKFIRFTGKLSGFALIFLSAALTVMRFLIGLMG